MRNFNQSAMIALVIVGMILISETFAQPPGKGGGGSNSSPYDLFRLSPPGAAAGSVEALQCNDSSNVVGWYRDSGNQNNGFFYNHSARSYTSLGVRTRAVGLNQSNEIVGEDLLLGVGLYWSSPSTAPIVLPPLAIHTHSKARAINESGLIIGQSYTPDAEWIAPGTQSLVAWRILPGGSVFGPVELPFLAGDWAGRVMDVSNSVEGVCVVVGSSGDTAAGPDEFPLPVAWSVVLTENGLLTFEAPIVEGDYDSGDANGVNVDGTSVGRAGLPTAYPFIKTAGQSMQLLPLLSKAVSGYATAINAAGGVVGTQPVQPRHNSTLQFTAVLWPSATNVVDLNTQVPLASGERLQNAFDINSGGDILAELNLGGTPCLLIKK